MQVMAAYPFSWASGDEPGREQLRGGFFAPITQAPLPVTVQWQKAGAGNHNQVENEILFLQLQSDWKWHKGYVPHSLRIQQSLREKGIPPWWSRHHTARRMEFPFLQCRKRRRLSGREDHLQIPYGYRGLKTGFFRLRGSGFFLHGAFCTFPCLFAEHGIFADHIKIFF